MEPIEATQTVLGAAGALELLKSGVDLNVETTPQSVSGAAGSATGGPQADPPAKRSVATAM